MKVTANKTAKVSIKKFFIYLFLIFLIISNTTKPPMLARSKNSCWTSTAIWLLYNIPELVDDLVTNETEYVKTSGDLKYLITLLKAMRMREEAGEETVNNKKQIEQLEKELEEARINYFNKVACPLSGSQPGDLGSAVKLFRTLMNKIPDSQKIITSPKTIYENFGLEKNDIKPYIYATYDFFYYDFNSSKYLPIKEFISMKEHNTSLSTNAVHDYELIGMGITTGGHAFALIKEQLEKAPAWYVCDDIGGIKKLDELPLDWPNKSILGTPTVMIYKKIASHHDSSPAIDEFARALSSF